MAYPCAVALQATKGREALSFYTIPEYEEWKETHNTRGWSIKYYKVGWVAGKGGPMLLLLCRWSPCSLHCQAARLMPRRSLERLMGLRRVWAHRRPRRPSNTLPTSRRIARSLSGTVRELGVWGLWGLRRACASWADSELRWASCACRR